MNKLIKIIKRIKTNGKSKIIIFKKLLQINTATEKYNNADID